MEKAARRERLMEAAHLQKIENNPLNAEDLAMFEMFEREGWSDEECLEHIAKLVASVRSPDAAAE